MNVLIACEESQTVCKAFREFGFNAYSCDLVECSGGHPEWHLLGDALDVIINNGGVTQNGGRVFVDKWDLMIAHPPCTYLTSSGAKWFYHPDDKGLPIEDRRRLRSKTFEGMAQAMASQWGAFVLSQEENK